MHCYCGLFLDTEVLVVWTQSDRENKASWKLSMRAPDSLPGIHHPQIWLVIPNRSHFSRPSFLSMHETKQQWLGKAASENSFLSRPPQGQHLSLIWSGRCPGGEKQPPAKCESSHPGADIKNCLMLVLWNCSFLSCDQQGKVQKPD